jgi:hypothetical protein
LFDQPEATMEFMQFLKLWNETVALQMKIKNGYQLTASKSVETGSTLLQLLQIGSTDSRAAIPAFEALLTELANCER